MATASAIGLRVAARLRDASQSELEAAGYLGFVNDALADLIAAGWLQPQATDTSLVVTQGTWEYDVPAGFAYIRRIEMQDSDGSYPVDHIVPSNHWEITNDAKFLFRPEFLSTWFVTGRALRITGQKRPTGDVAGSATIVPGMEAFVRERAVHYAASYLGFGDSNLATYRQRLSESTWATSEKFLAQHPMEFRVKPSSVLVPGR